MMPVRPPIRNMERKPRQKSIGDATRILPPYIVASQLKNLMPVGTETRKVAATKKRSCVRVMPTANMWCAQTPRLMKAMAAVAAAMNS